MSRRDFYDHPSRIPGRKSIVREGPAPLRKPLAGGANVTASTSGSLSETIQKYKYFILAGAGVLVLAIAYHLYSKKNSQGKDESVTEKGMSAISEANRPSLQVDPAVLDQLQQQVMQYRDHINMLQNEVMKRDQQLDMVRQQTQQLGPESGFTTMAGQLGMGASALPPGSLGQFSGLHGQLPPYVPPGGGGQINMGLGQPLPTREPMSQMGGQMNPATHPLLGNFPTMFPGQGGQGGMGSMPGMPPQPGGMMSPSMLANQPIGSAQMSAFSNEPGINSQPMTSQGMFGANAQMFVPFQR